MENVPFGISLNTDTLVQFLALAQLSRSLKPVSAEWNYVFTDRLEMYAARCLTDSMSADSQEYVIKNALHWIQCAFDDGKEAEHKRILDVLDREHNEYRAKFGRGR